MPLVCETASVRLDNGGTDEPRARNALKSGRAIKEVAGQAPPADCNLLGHRSLSSSVRRLAFGFSERV